MEQLPRLSDYYPRLAKIGQAIIRWATGPEPLASHGDHLFENNHRVPFEEQLSLWDDLGCYYEGDDLSNWPVYSTPPTDPYAPNGWGYHETVVSDYLRAKE